MLKKLSKSRKKKPTSKLTNSRSKIIKQPLRQQIQIKQHKISNKNNHHVSTLSLLSNHNASQCSINDEGKTNKIKKSKNKNRQSSLSLLMKQGAMKDKDKSKNTKDNKKTKKNSSANQNSKSKKTIVKISPLKVDKSDKNIKVSKQNAGKKSKICNQEQLYQRINLGLFKSKTNSQINFSNNSSVRENNSSVHVVSKISVQNRHKKTLTIDCSDQYILSQYFSNSRIKNFDKKKNQAAIKIQKVFRGYLTRKMLQQYIKKQEQRLIQLSKKSKTQSRKQSSDLPFQERQKISSLNSEYKKSQPDSQRLTNARAPPKMFMQNNINPITFDKKQKNKLSLSQICGQQIDISMKNSKKQRLTPINHQALDQQSSIYGPQHDSVSRYLPFDSKNQEVNQHSQSLFYENAGEQVQQYEEDESNLARLKNSGRVMEDKSQQMLKYTPSSYAPKSKSKVQDPMPTDFSDKRVEQFEYDGPQKKSRQLFQQFNQKNKNIKAEFPLLQPSRSPQRQIEQFSKNMKKFENQINKHFERQDHQHQMQNQNQKKLISMLKKQQKQKWSTIIQMLSHQIEETKSRNLDNEKFMSMILQFSKKNKQELQKSASFSFEDFSMKGQIKNITQQESKLMKKSQLQPNYFKKEKLSPVCEQNLSFESRNAIKTQRDELKLQKNMDLPLRDKRYTNLSINIYNNYIPKHQTPIKNRENISIFQKTEQLKKFWKKNWTNYPVQQMVFIREKALEKKQMEMVNRLNQDLFNQRLTHQEFITRLSELQGKFQNQRELINKAKMEIFLGCRATHKLLHDSARDAWYLGFKIPLSHSLKQFRSNNNDLWVKNLIVDELKVFSQHKQHENHDKQKDQMKSSIPQRRQYSIDDSIESLSQQKQRSSQKRRQDLSISIPHEDSSLTIRPSNQVSQQSLYSEEISYNEGDVEMHLLDHEQKSKLIFQEDEDDDESEDENEQAQNVFIQGFRKVDPQKLIKKVQGDLKSNQMYGEGPLLSDPVEQQKVQKQVMKKISFNQPKSNESFYRLQELRKYQMTPRHKASEVLQPKSQIYKVDISSDSESEQVIFSEEKDPQIKRITEEQISRLIWEAVNQIFIHQNIRHKFCKIKNKSPAPIEFEERKSFCDILVSQIPSFVQLLPRINQKMVASRLQLLKFMRVSFDEDDLLEQGQYHEQNFDTSEQFQEIGKFEHILPAQVCIKALDKYIKAEQDKQFRQYHQNQQQAIQNKVISKYGMLISSECSKKVIERQKTLLYNQIQRIDLRKQIKKVEYHCIFDALNQILMKKRLRSIGYSGIGLNQLSIVLQKQNFKQVKHQQQFNKILKQSVEQLDDLISNDKTNNEKLLMQNYERLRQNDSQWIFYTDEALSFALQIVYMLEDEIFFEEATQIFKKSNNF